MKLGKILYSMFLFAFLSLTVHKTQEVMISAEELTNTSAKVCGPSKINLEIFVCSFEVCRVS